MRNWRPRRSPTQKPSARKEALDGKLIDFVATSPEDLLAKLDGRTITRFDGSTVQLALSNVSTVPVGMTVREKFLSRIVEPDVFFILLIAGAARDLYRVHASRPFCPGRDRRQSRSCWRIISMQMLPVNLAGLLLIVLALGLFVLEAKYPTHGVLGVGGVVSMVLGALFLIRTPWTGMGVSLGTALGVALPFAVIVIVLMRLVLRSRSWKQATGKEELLAEEGEVTEPVGSAPGEGVAIGMVRIHGELWRAAATRGSNDSERRAGARA